jgi:hypothetical protein
LVTRLRAVGLAKVAVRLCAGLSGCPFSIRPC